MKLLDINNLTVRFQTNDGLVHAVNGISLSVAAGETLGIVGESGSGKSQLAFAILGLLAANGQATGEVLFAGKQLLNLPTKQLNQIRSRQIGMIFQDPMTSLNPYLKVSRQLGEVLQLHRGLSQREALQQAIQMLDAVRIPDARSRIHSYPHEFSGGMRQRLMIAMALLCRPQLLIADEPTTALDVTVQAQIMALLGELQREFGTAIMLITHDLALVAGSCDRTLVMYSGRVMEQASTANLFNTPTHPYTRGLLAAIPRPDRSNKRLLTIPGSPPNVLKTVSGCPFNTRCRQQSERCLAETPELQAYRGDHLRACHHAVEALE